MVNLEQIRAKNAMLFANSIRSGAGEGKPDAVVKKTASRIVQNGFLGALAFALEKGEGMSDTFGAILYHLLDADVNSPIQDGRSEFEKYKNKIPSPKDEILKEAPLEEFMKRASSSEISALELQSVTDEAMCFLSFLRRFVKS